MLLPKSPLSSRCFWNCLNNEAPGEFVLFYPFLRRDWRSPRQAQWAAPTGGHWGWLTQSSRPRELFVCCPALGPAGLCGMFICILVSLPFIFFLIFFSCQGKQWLSREEFPIFQKWWKALACDSSPRPRSCYGSEEACVGNGKEACQRQQPAYYCQALLPRGVCPPRGPRRTWG